LFVFSDKVLISVIIIIIATAAAAIIINIKKMKKLLLTSPHLTVKYLSRFCDCFVFDDNNYKRSVCVYTHTRWSVSCYRFIFYFH
jgi:hypothetical protein